MVNRNWLSQVARYGLLAAIGLVHQPLLAGDTRLSIQVLDEQTGVALEGVGVCLGTAAEPDQLGALRTDASGRVVFRSVPPSSLQLVLSGVGYVGKKRVIEPMYGSGTLVLKLAPGWQESPHCSVPDSAGSGTASGLRITDLEVTPLSTPPRTVRLGLRTQGNADQLRISEREDFRDAQWQPYRQELNFAFGAGGQSRHLFVQVRRTAGRDSASIEVLSPVKSVSVTLP